LSSLNFIIIPITIARFEFHSGEDPSEGLLGCDSITTQKTSA